MAAADQPRSLTAADLAELVRGELDGPSSLVLHGVDAMQSAGSGVLTFITSDAYAKHWSDAAASAALVTRGIEVPGHDAGARALIVVDDAELAMNTVLTHFAPEADWPEPGVHTTAIVHESAGLGSGVRIGPRVLVGAGVELGDDVVLCAGAQVGRGARIGSGSVVGPQSVIGRDCIIGNRCQLQPYVSIGADGFGYRPNADRTGLEKVPQNGIVRIGEDRKSVV